jgi:hypothetical protein
MRQAQSRTPVAYIASPYTKGDVAMNTHYQCKVFDQLLTDGRVIPIAPLWSHFQHTVLPRRYADWIAYDQSLLPLYDCCIRLSASLPEFGYLQEQSSGADAEVATFHRLGKPVFHTIDDMYRWVETEWKSHDQQEEGKRG